MAQAENEMDVVTMNIIESTLLSMCREMGITLMKTSYSTIFSESLDFTCAIADTEGKQQARLDAYADEQPGKEFTLLIDMNRTVVVDPESEQVI
jgi:hypothetical protein